MLKPGNTSCILFDATSEFVQNLISLNNELILRRQAKSNDLLVADEVVASSNETLTTESPASVVDYNYHGALHYILFIIVVYAIAVVALIKLQIKKSDMQYYEDSDDPQDNTAHNVLKRIRTEDTKRQALGIFFIFIFI